MAKPARKLHIVHDELDFADSDDEQVIDPSTHTWRFKVRDEDGNWEQLNLKYPANWVARLMTIVSDSNTPFKSIQDVMRNATFHYMIFMDGWLKNPELTELMQLTLQQQEIDSRRAEIAHRKSVVETSIELIDEALDAEDWQEAREAIERGQEVVATSRVNTTKLREKITEARAKVESHG